MKTFKVEFVFDTGITYENRMCIIRAGCRSEVIGRFLKWIGPQLGSDESIIPNSIKIKEIADSEIVVYTDFRSYYKKANKRAI